jgi:AraC-like DNA-binding protein
MDFQTKYITKDIKLSEYRGELYKAEAAFDDHILVWLISGETRIIQGEASYTLGAGNIFLIPRNHVATFLNYSHDGRVHKSVTMHLTVPMLERFYTEHLPVAVAPIPVKVMDLGKHPLLESCLASLIPYFDVKGAFPSNIAALKLVEAVSILRLVEPAIDSILANFEEPGKIDLAGFMEKNYMSNLPMARFGYLTGRSLSTFQRDFKRIFHTTPQRWLTRKRLELAHYKLEEKKERPVDVYLEVGFEDLSHFSYAFRKCFGYSPAELAEKVRT